MMSARTGAAAILAGLLCAVVAVDHAAGNDGSSWPRFPGASYSSQSEPTDKEFIKEWEAAPPKGYPTLSPANVPAMKAAIKRYTDIVAGGGWQPLPEDLQLQSGESHPAVAVLRNRLILSGDLRESGQSHSFDFYVDKAVKRYQAANGLAPTGILDKRTIAALNVPAAARLKQLKSNLERLAQASKSAARKYVLVNIPAAQIEVQHL